VRIPLLGFLDLAVREELLRQLHADAHHVWALSEWSAPVVAGRNMLRL
jgi:hypothetical protein